MKTAINLTALVTAALIGSATILQPVNAQSHTSPDNGNRHIVQTVDNGVDAGQPRDAKAKRVEQALNSFDSEVKLSYEESRQLLKLSNASWAEKCEFVRMGLSEAHSERLRIHAASVAHAVIALDPSGELSEDLLQVVLMPALESKVSPPETAAAAFELLMHLRVDNSKKSALLLEWLKDEDHSPLHLDKALTSYAYLMNREDAATMAMLLVANPEKHDYVIGDCMKALARVLPAETLKPLVKRLLASCEKGKGANTLIALASKLEPRELIPITEAILGFLRDEQDIFVLASHAQILGRLSENLDAAAVRPLADLLLLRLKTQKGVYPVNMLSSALSHVAVKLGPDDVQPIVDAVVHRIQSEANESTRGVLGVALGKLALNLEPARLTPVAELIMDEIRKQEGYQIDELSQALAELGGRLSPADRTRYAASIIDHIATKPDSAGVWSLGQALAALIEDLDVNKVRPLSSVLVQQILAERVSPGRLVSLCEVLGVFAEAEALRSEELLPVASVLINKINSEKDLFQRHRLMGVLWPLAKRLTVHQRRPFVTQLVDRMKAEDDAEMLADLGYLVTAMSLDLAEAEVLPAIVAIATRIKLEQMDSSLSRLVDVMETLIENWGPAAARSFGGDLIPRLSEERHGSELVLLAELIGNLSAHMSPEDRNRARAVMVERLENIRDGATLVQLAEVIGALPGQPEGERHEAAELLLAGLAQASYLKTWRYDQQEKLPGLKSILAEAELQSLVDALKAPLLTDRLVADTILKTLEHKTGRNFDGDVWRFVEWATTDPQGKRLALDLKGAGPWAVFDEPKLIAFPPLQGISFEQQGTLQVKGAVWDFVVDGDIAYLPAGTRGLRLVDVSDPAKPREVGHADAGPHAKAVCVAGDYAYVTAGPAGFPQSHLHVVDISTANAPKVVGSIDLPDYPSGVAVRDNLVYVADHSEGLRIIDVSNPQTPKEVGFLKTPGFIVDVALAGNYAFLADQEVGLRAIDISAPNTPAEVGLLRMEGSCIDICVQGERVYAATGDGGLIVVDISNPQSLTEIARIPTEIALSVASRDNFVVVGAAKFGSRVFDLTDPTKPVALDLEMSANGGGAFFHKNSLFIGDVSLSGMPYGWGSETILRAYKVIGLVDTGEGEKQPPVDAKSDPPKQHGAAKFEETPPDAREEWHPAENVSNDEGVSMMPSLQVGPRDDVHLVWMGRNEGVFDIFYSRRTNEKWSSPVKVSQADHQSMFPSLAVSKKGDVYVVWMGGKPGSFDIYLSRGAGEQWSKPINISNNEGISQRPKIALDPSGRAHVIWYDNTGGSFELWHAQYKSGNWSPSGNTKLADWYLTNDPSLTLSPGLSSDSRGNIHVVWPDIDVATRHLFHSRWDGRVWSDKEKVSGAHHRRTSEATITADPADNMHAAWFDRDDVWYGKRSGEGWSEPVRVGRKASLPTIYADQAGVVHLAFTSNSQIHYSRKSSSAWSDNRNISESPGECAAPTLVTDSAGRVHVAWMDDRPGNLDILYRQSAERE